LWVALSSPSVATFRTFGFGRLNTFSIDATKDHARTGGFATVTDSLLSSRRLSKTEVNMTDSLVAIIKELAFIIGIGRIGSISSLEGNSSHSIPGKLHHNGLSVVGHNGGSDGIHAVVKTGVYTFTAISSTLDVLCPGFAFCQFCRNVLETGKHERFALRTREILGACWLSIGSGSQRDQS
jgi:hypothetical protein